MRNSWFKNHDWFMTLAIFMLLLVGVIVIYSATFTAETLIEGAGTVNRQLVFIILGFAVYFLFSRIDPTYFRYFPIQIITFLTTISLLIYVWLYGDPIRNTNRWIEWGFIRIQPSEYTKITLILLNSVILSKILKIEVTEDIDWGEIWKKKSLSDKLSNFLKNFTSLYPLFYHYGIAILLSAVCIGLILVEPALGNASITALICMAMYLISYPNQKHLFGQIFIFIISINIIGNFVNFGFLYDKIGFSLIIGNLDILILFLSLIIIIFILHFLKLRFIPVLFAVIAGISSFLVVNHVWNNVLKDYQKQRIEVFFSPEDDPQGAGWQLRQAKIAIGSGRIFGKGFLQGSQSKLRYLPEAYSDFIFAAFCEEFGLIGAVFILALYFFLLLRIIKSAKSANNQYESLICFGVAVMILVHVFINMGMNMGILPITGIPLPLISYGGSSVMVTMMAMGLVQAVNMNRDNVDIQESLVVTSKSRIFEN